MSDIPNVPNDDDELEPSHIAGLRDAARKGTAAVKEADRLKRENFFLRAGVDTESELGQMLFATHQGDDIEELKAKYGRLAGLQQTQAQADAAAAEAAARAAEDAQRTAMQNGLTNGIPAGDKVEGPHPRDAALEQYQIDIRSGVNEEVARTNAMGKVLSAGLVHHDKRVLFDAEAHAAAAAEADRFANNPR